MSGLLNNILRYFKKKDAVRIFSLIFLPDFLRYTHSQIA